MNQQVPYTRHVIQGIAPGGFNGALLPVRSGIREFALVYRDDGYPRPDGSDTAPLGLRSVYLDKEYQPVTQDKKVSIPNNIDPRLIWWNAKPYMLSRYIGPRWRVELWPLNLTDDRIDVFDGWPHWPFDKIGNWKEYRMPFEGNWVPFEEDTKLYIVHYPRPHRILRVHDDGKIERVVECDWVPPRGWSTDLRGSTPPAQLPDGTWLGTFHTHSLKHEYHTGFYRFSPRQPWLVLGASRTPVWGPEDSRIQKPWRYGIPNYFPMSLQVEGDLVRVAAGIAGTQVVVDHLSLDDILKDMAPI